MPLFSGIGWTNSVGVDQVCNRDFHRALISGCNNIWLLHFRSILLDHASRYIRLSLASQPIPRDFHREHRDLYRAALARDAERASEILEDHIDQTVNAIARIVSVQTGCTAPP
jgi:DNA-binding GntR family transcriptional regulator